MYIYVYVNVYVNVYAYVYVYVNVYVHAYVHAYTTEKYENIKEEPRIICLSISTINPTLLVVINKLPQLSHGGPT